MAFFVTGEDLEVSTLEELTVFLRELARRGEQEGCIHSRYVYGPPGAGQEISRAAVVSLGAEFGCLEVFTLHQGRDDWYIFVDAPERSIDLFRQVVTRWPAASFEHIPSLYQGDTIDDSHDLLDHGFLPVEVVLELIGRYLSEDVPAGQIAGDAGLTLSWFSGLHTERTAPYYSWDVGTGDASGDAE